jgi:hypothetical protein
MFPALAAIKCEKGAGERAKRYGRQKVEISPGKAKLAARFFNASPKKRLSKATFSVANI